MATEHRNLSAYDAKTVPSGENLRIGLVVAEWNYEITSSLTDSAINTLIRHGVNEDDIVIRHVPGSFELTLGAQFFAEYGDFDAIICIGCIIQGETRHFDFICQSVTQGLTQLNMEYNLPIVFGVLTTDTIEQAQDRAGGKYGNKGDEAAVTAIKMAVLQNELESYEDEQFPGISIN